VEFLCLALVPIGNPVVAYRNADDLRPTVRRWNGSNWLTVGPEGFASPTSSLGLRWLRVNDQGHAVVAYAKESLFARQYDLFIGLDEAAGPGNWGLSLFPNPAHEGRFTLHMGGLSQDRAPVLVTVRDATGRTVHQEQAKADWGTLQLQLNLSPGLYLVDVSVGNHRTAGKLLVE